MPIEGLDRCIAALLSAHKVETNGLRFRPLASKAMAGYLFDVFGYLAPRLALSFLVQSALQLRTPASNSATRMELAGAFDSASRTTH
jgi:hypothetical protein